MTIEPITIFARIADPAKVVKRLRELAPAVDVDGPDDAWRHAVAAFGKENERKLIFTHDPAYYSEPNWSVQMEEMRGYFARFPRHGSKVDGGDAHH